jgi:hypothetical protein
LIIETKGQTIPLEIKSSETVHANFFDTARWFQEQTRDASDPIVVYGGMQEQKRSCGNVISWTQLAALCDRLA